MADQALLDRLKRYSKKCLTERTDPDFAEAVYEAVDVIDGLLNDLQEALDTIEELTDTNVGKWIPVTERLPNYGEKCLVVFQLYSHNDVSIGISYCYVQKEGFFSDTGRDWRVTHWMPLPEPPKDGE